MLTLTIPGGEYFNSVTQEFVEEKPITVSMEHSLVSISKWEAKWGKPFLSKEKKHEKTPEEILDYMCCMVVGKNVDPSDFVRLTRKQVEEINEYIEAPMTATWFREDKNAQKRNGEIVTSELIYYWMIAMNIPFECQKWHLNRLLTLIRVCSIKNSPNKKMSRKEMLAQRKALNDSRRKSLNTLG